MVNKIVAVLNGKIEAGKAMNALAHMSIGLGGVLDSDSLRLTNYKDASGGDHKNISEMPFIILKSKNSNQIRTLRKAALNNSLSFTDFHDKMTIGTYPEQIEASSKTKEEDLEYFGIVLFGDGDLLRELTKKFSLWK